MNTSGESERYVAEAVSLKPSGPHLPLRILSMDPQRDTPQSLAELVEQEEDISICGQAATAEEAFHLLEEAEPNVAVVDISLDDAHGLELIQNLRMRHPGLRIVVFSACDEEAYAERALRAGAAGYVMRGANDAHLVEAIRFVAEGGVYLSRRMTSVLLGKVADSGGDASAPGFPIDELTDREMEVFQMLGEGKSVDEIADQLSLGRKTVETYRRRAKEKLGLESVAKLRHFAVQWVISSRHLEQV